MNRGVLKGSANSIIAFIFGIQWLVLRLGCIEAGITAAVSERTGQWHYGEELPAAMTAQTVPAVREGLVNGNGQERH